MAIRPRSLDPSRVLAGGAQPVRPTWRLAGWAVVFLWLPTFVLAGVVVVPVVVVLVVVVCVVQAGLVIVFVSSVTAPFLASSRPSTVAPVVAVMLVRARMVPRKLDPVPSVAELPTCQ